MKPTSSPGTTPPLEEAWTIPASWYVDAAHFARERERVLTKAWHFAAPLDHLAQRGSYATLDVCGEPVVVVRGTDDVIRALSNVCRHRAGRVVDGAGCAQQLRCTYHGWTYGLDGCLLGAPEMQEARAFAHADFGLRPLRAAVWQRSVFVCLDEAAPAFAMPALDTPELTSVADVPWRERRTYDIACNWKVYVDNFLEAYHVPRAHPGLHALLDYKRYVVEPRGATVVQRAPGRKRGDPGAAYLWLFPLFMLNVTPGYVQTNAIMPLAVDRTRVVFDFFGKRLTKKAAAFSEEVQQEDIALCEAVHKNLHSRFYTAGRYCPRRENGVHHFHGLLRAALA